MLTLGVLGGAFITFGAIFATVALSGAEGVLPFGIARVVAGLVFALGLSLVLIGGALGAALLVRLTSHHPFGGGQVGPTALRTAEAKAALPFDQAVVLGILCNTLVCLAVWLSLFSRQPAHRAILTILPIAAFVAAGFEHAVANMYFLSFGLLIKNTATDSFWTTIHASPARFPSLTLAGIAHNLAAVTIGNIISGAVLVAGVYWLLDRRPAPSSV